MNSSPFARPSSPIFSLLSLPRFLFFSLDLRYSSFFYVRLSFLFIRLCLMSSFAPRHLPPGINFLFFCYSVLSFSSFLFLFSLFSSLPFCLFYFLFFPSLCLSFFCFSSFVLFHFTLFVTFSLLYPFVSPLPSGL